MSGMTKNIFLPLEVHEAGLAWDAPLEAQYDLALIGGEATPRQYSKCM